MTLPLASLGIYIPSYRVTKKGLLNWTNSGVSHTVVLFSNGGIFTSEGDGFYKSTRYEFETVNDFWKFARNHLNRAVMTET